MIESRSNAIHNHSKYHHCASGDKGTCITHGTMGVELTFASEVVVVKSLDEALDDHREVIEGNVKCLSP